MGRNSGWPEYLAGLEESLRASIQALSDSQYRHILCPWIRRCKKICAGNRRPNDDGGCTTSPLKYDNLRQEVNGKPHKHQLDTLIDSKPNTRGNIDAIKSDTYTTGPYEHQKLATENK